MTQRWGCSYDVFLAMNALRLLGATLGFTTVNDDEKLWFNRH